MYDERESLAGSLGIAPVIAGSGWDGGKEKVFQEKLRAKNACEKTLQSLAKDAHVKFTYGAAREPHRMGPTPGDPYAVKTRFCGTGRTATVSI